MNIQKQEAERILKASNKVTAITCRKSDTPMNKKQEHQSLTRLVDQKITQGKEVTVIVIENLYIPETEEAFPSTANIYISVYVGASVCISGRFSENFSAAKNRGTKSCLNPEMASHKNVSDRSVFKLVPRVFLLKYEASVSQHWIIP